MRNDSEKVTFVIEIKINIKIKRRNGKPKKR